MKVYIGNYRTHRWYHRLLKWYPDQKKYIKIDKWDTWSMDHTLAEFIVPMLRQLRDNTHSAPFVDLDDRPEHLIGTIPKREQGDVDEFHFEAWDWVLSEMLFAFEGKHNDWEQQFYSGECDIEWKLLEGREEEMYEMVHGPNHTWEIDREGRDAYQKRITNGFRLFGRYYENLWD